MGWTSFLEDIQKRLDDAMPRLSLPPDNDKQSNIGIDGLQKTNALLREKNAEFLRVIVALRDEITSKKATDFCETECVRLRKANFDLVSRLKYLQEAETPLNLPSKREAHAPKQSKNTAQVPQHLSEAKQRFQDAQKIVETAKKDWKRAQKACAEAQNEYQRLLQTERNSTQHIHESGIIHRQNKYP